MSGYHQASSATAIYVSRREYIEAYFNRSPVPDSGQTTSGIFK